jgi:hypothetical protein
MARRPRLRWQTHLVWSRRSFVSQTVALGTLVLLSTVARYALSRGVEAPWIAPDEALYGLLGRSLYSGSGLGVLGGATPYYSLLYPLVAGLPSLTHHVTAALDGVQALQALLMSLTAVPVFLWTRSITGPRHALVAAGLTVLVPGLVYSGLLMSEALYYPVATFAAWALAAVLEKPTPTRQAALLAALAVAAATRLQAIAFLPTLLLAAGLLSISERSRSALRRLVPTFVAIGAAALAWIGLHLASGSGSDLLGGYAPAGKVSSYGVGGSVEWIGWHVGGVFLLTAGVPLVALGILAVQTLRGAEHQAAVRALVVTAVAYTAVTVVEVGVFASRFVDHLAERQLLSLAPPLFAAFAVWLRRGAPRPQPETSVVAFLVAVPVLLLPLDKVATAVAAPDSPSTIPLERLGRHLSDGTLEAVYVGIAAAVILLAVFIPRALAPALAGLVAVLLATGSLLVSGEIRQLSRTARASTFADAAPDWIDSSGARDAALLSTGERSWPGIWRELFWNPSVARVLALPGGDVPGPLPQTVVQPGPDGRLYTTTGRPVAPRYVVAPADISLSGEQIAAIPASFDQEGAAVWRTERPVRLLQWVSGLKPNGDLPAGSAATVEVFACGPGRLELTLLGKEGLPTRLLLDGKVVAERAIPPGSVWRPAVPAPRNANGSGRCDYELRTDGLIGSTRVEFVRE